jgi:uracil-DNA glycosylase
VNDLATLAELELLAVARLYQLETQARGTEKQVRGPRPETQQGAASAGGENSTVLVPQASGLVPSLADAGWDEIRSLVRTCTACVLCQKRKQAVFGVGSESAAWMFVGEGPGADEDELGEPFVGQAGRLLDSMLAAIGCERGREVYITNVVKCRPPGNRTPLPEEAAACAQYLDRQIELIRPGLIVALGKTAMTRLLGTEASLASQRGKVHRYRGTPVVVTYHPAYLLRSLPEKAKAWEDLLFARRTLRASA